MGRYLLGCLAAAVPTLLLLTLVAFVLTSAARGDPAEAALRQSGYEPTPEQIAAYRHQLGLDLELNQLEATAPTDASKAGNFDMLLGGNCFPNGDPDFILCRALYSKSDLNAKGNGNGGYDNPEADKFLDKARVTLDPAARAKIYDQLQQIAVRDTQFSPLYDEQEIIAWRPNVRGVSQSLIYQPSLDQMYLVK